MGVGWGGIYWIIRVCVCVYYNRTGNRMYSHAIPMTTTTNERLVVAPMVKKNRFKARRLIFPVARRRR